LQGEIYYAPVEPDHNILCLVAPHFASRLADQNWIIHDLKRGMAVVYNQTEWVITPVDSAELIQYSQEEEVYQALWQRFFEQIAIQHRTNPELQRRLMPARYWRHLVEKVEQKPKHPQIRW
jgi:probable DNA metabolism protein